MRHKFVALTFSALLLAGCGGWSNVTEEYNDAPRGSNNDEPADTMSMPDGFSNVAHKCDGPNMVYVIFKGDAAYGAIDVVPNDPRCVSEPG